MENKSINGTIPGSRMFFVDNLRIVLTILVVLHHIALVYGSGAPFYYWEAPTSFAAFKGFLVFVLLNQGFFMGSFFLLSGFFVPRSYDKKQAGSYLKGRLLRLGIPLAVFIFVLNPIAEIAIYQMPADIVGALAPPAWSIFPEIIGLGPLWFVEMLLMFDFLYTLWRLIGRNRKPVRSADAKSPTYLGIGIFTAVLAGVSYLLRMVIPMGVTVPFFQFPTFAYIPQYLSFFIVGIVAYRRNWFTAIPNSMGYVGFGLAAAAAILLFPLALSGKMFSLQLSAVSSSFVGNGTWYSAVYALWDSLFSVGMSLGLITLFRRWFNRQGRLGRVLAGQSYAVYLVHIPIVVYLAVLLSGLQLDSVAKFMVAAVIMVPACFASAWVLIKIPGVSRII